MTKFTLLIFMFFCVGLFYCNKSNYTKISATMVIFNGRVWTADSHNPNVQAIAIKNDKILAVGNDKEIKKYIDNKTEVINAQGKFVCPGFTDSHLHFLDGGQRLASVQLRDAKTPEEFIKRVKEYTQTIKPGTWIIGGDWDHKNWGGELPDRSWIDDITPENPVWISRLDGHMALANSLALKLANLNDSVNNIAGGVYVRDKNGSLTGILKDNAMYKIESIIPDYDDEMLLRFLDAANEYVLSNGVTSVHNMGSWNDVRIFEKARENNKLKVRIFSAVPINTHKQLKQRKENKGWGDEWVKLGGLKGFLDGSLGSHTALMFEGYTDKPKDSGLLVTTEQQMYEYVKAGDEFGAQSIIHAIGDKANNIALNIYEKVKNEHGKRDRRFRIEHAQHLLSTDIPRFSELSVIASMQPYHCIDDGRWAEPLLGKERIKTTHAYKSLLENNVSLVFGSDWFVAPPTPLEGIYAAITRATLDGKNEEGWVPEQKINIEDAIKAYTITPAYASFEENIKGSIQPGKLADIIILDKDITKITAKEIWNTKVDITIVGGKIMYQR